MVVGKEDVLTPPAEMEQMAGAITGGRFVEIGAAGHLANLEKPVEFNAAVAEWLSSSLAR
ncbi:putative non-heme bromoperoxidase BpoC [compost metagenome]